MRKKAKSVYFFLAFIFLAFSFNLANTSKGSPGKRIVVACVGDSLMRPMPLYLRRLLPMRKIAIKDWAQGGLSAATYLSFFKAHPQWSREKIDLILVQLGTNDVSLFLKKEEDDRLFLVHYKEIIKNLKKIKGNFFRHPQIIVASVPPFSGVEGEVERNKLIDEVINPTIRKLAKEENLFLVDHWSKFIGQRDLYEADGVHPNREGEKVLARNWRRAIRLCCLSRKKRPFKRLRIEALINWIARAVF